MSNQSAIEKIIEDALRNASNSERSEFDKRFGNYLNIKRSLVQAEKKKVNLESEHQKILKEQSKTENVLIAVAAISFLVGSFFNSSKFSNFEFLLFCLIFGAAIFLHRTIYARTFVLEIRIYENEIARCNNELSQFNFYLINGHHLVNDDDIPYYQWTDGMKQQKMDAYIELKHEILKSLYLLPKD